MSEIQRARMLDAMVRAACERGAANVTVANVTAGAGVSRRTFYELFADSQECLLAAIEHALRSVGEVVLPAYENARGGWQGRIGAGLVALLGLFDQQPHLARLLVVEWLAAGHAGLERRRRLMERIALALDEGRPKGSPEPPPLAAEATVGAVCSVLHGRLTCSSPVCSSSSSSSSSGRGRARPEPGLTELVNPLMSMIVLPYLGAAAARRELERPVPQIAVNGGGGRPAEDLLKGLNMRLTYRTMRVLAAVAASPGTSNRAVALSAGIGDQGQISKLLARLQRLGLIENTAPPVKGEPNVWTLTAKGAQLERVLRP